MMGEEMFRLKDRKGADVVLGMTHEEIFTTLASELSSYRELPQFWYQFQLKFRDEPRPKSGLIRVREFTMKDSYSFDLDEAGLDASFDAHRGAYERIFARLGIPGASRSRPPAGTWAAATRSSSCARQRPGRIWSPAARQLRLRRQPGEGDVGAAARRTDGQGTPEPRRLPTPGVRTIDDLANKHGIAADRQVKTLVQVIDGQLTLVLLRGDHPLAGPEADRRDRRRRHPAGPARGDRRGARRVAGQPRRCRESRTCRSSPTWRCRAAPTWRPGRMSTRCTSPASTSPATSPSAVGRPARGPGRRAVPALRHAA
jgi:hypothetical protein